MWKSAKIAEILDGKLYGSGDASFSGCSIDSRQIKGGELFVALPGERVDGHSFIGKAYEQGAQIVIAEKARLERLQIDIPRGKALIAVENSLRGFQDLAKAFRDELNPVVIGVTGSNGKTTTKDMIASVLAQRYRVHKNLENHNTEIGLPLTILNAPQNTEIMVLEMGMRGLGQIQILCEIARPQTGVITNIGTTHLELLGSQENITRAKWELIDNLPDNGTAVLNAEDRESVRKAQQTAKKKFFYGIYGRYKDPDIIGRNLEPSGILGTSFEVISKGEKAKVYLPLPGEHNVLDSLAALTVGKIYGISLEEGAAALKSFKLSKMRLEILQGINNSIIINDVYNANPISMKASLSVLKERGGERTVAVLGEMYELGDAALSGHREVGKTAAELRISELVTVGKLAEEIAHGALQTGLPAERVHICSDVGEASAKAKELIRKLGKDTWVLVKGSRGMKMEKISFSLQESQVGRYFS